MTRPAKKRLATRARETTTKLLAWRPAARPARLDTSTGLVTQRETEAFVLFLKEASGRVVHQHLGTPDPCAHCTTLYVIERLERQLGRYLEPTDQKTAEDQIGGTARERTP